MPRVITFSSEFPSYHSKVNHPTEFPHKILSRIKITTIRNGHRWKEGDVFSPRRWSGKPYRSPMITLADPITVIKVYNFEKRSINDPYWYLDGRKIISKDLLYLIAKNDGFEHSSHGYADLKEWLRFPTPFDGQIICWGETDYNNPAYFEKPLTAYQSNA